MVQGRARVLGQSIVPRGRTVCCAPHKGELGTVTCPSYLPTAPCDSAVVAGCNWVVHIIVDVSTYIACLQGRAAEFTAATVRELPETREECAPRINRTHAAFNTNHELCHHTDDVTHAALQPTPGNLKALISRSLLEPDF
jgi:hypothetical protein